MEAKTKKDLLLRARVVVRTSNMKISRRCLADYVKKLHQNKACRTCRKTIFPHSTNQIMDLWPCRYRHWFSLLTEWRDSFKALANEDTLLWTHCCSWCFLGAQTRGTQNECCLSSLRKLGNSCCRHKMFLNKMRNFFVSVTNAARAGKRGNICVSNNVFATMCPSLPGPFISILLFISMVTLILDSTVNLL